MILDNVKERLLTAKEDINFIKECLWPGKNKLWNWNFEKRATWRKFLFGSKKSAGSRQKD